MSNEKKNATVKVAKPSNANMALIGDLSALPSLEGAIVIPIDLMQDYWTPENAGEKKRLFYSHCSMRDVEDTETGEVKELLCAFFLEQLEDGTYKTVCNGSRRLVGVFETDRYPAKAAFQITYMGKRRNSTNQFSSDNWQIMPLNVKVA